MSAVDTERGLLLTADDKTVAACTDAPGAEHDYRVRETVINGRTLQAPVCVWCSAAACGTPDERDPCIEPFHHRRMHRTARGITWPIGENRR